MTGDVSEIYAIESTPPICFLIHTPGTQERRTVWLLSNSNTRIFKGNTSGTMHMEAFKNTRFNFTFTLIIPLTNKGSGHWYLRDEAVSTRSPKEWPMDISLEDLLSYVHDAKAATLLEDKTSVSGEVDCGKAMKGCAAWFPMLLLMVDERKLIYNSILNVASSTKDASTHEAMLFGCRTLPPLLNAAYKTEDMNTREMLRLVVDVNEIDTIESSSICMFLLGASSTQGPRTVWLLLKNSAREAFQNTFSHLNSTCMTLWALEKNQAMMKKNQRISGGWLVKKEWGRSYKPCFHNQKGNNFKHDGVSIDNNGLLFSSHFGIGSALLLADAKAASPMEDKTAVSGQVDCRKAMKGCVASSPMLPLMVDEKTSIYNSILNSTHECSEMTEALLSGCRTLPPLPNAAKVGDVTKSDSVLVSIFVRNFVSTEPLVLTLNLDESSQHMMCLYAQKTNTKLDLQYFIYGRKMLEPDSTLLSYGVKANSTIHACSRLRGGAVTMTKYLKNNKKKFLIEVDLPNGMVSLEMTKIGCLFLSTWLKCFTQAFANSKSWDGSFTKDYFKVVHGHVLVNTGAGCDAKLKLDSSCMRADMAMLVQFIREIFYTDNSNLVSKFPPYMENLITFLGSMGSPKLYDHDRLFIETHLCCMESAARGVLLLMVQRKLKSLNTTEQEHWQNTMGSIDRKKYYANATDLSTTAVFQDVIIEANRRGEEYGTSKSSTFRLMRDHYTHSPKHRFDKSSDTWEEKFKNDDGIELMIPAHNKDFLPDIIYNMIKDKKVDIKAQLLEAQVRCTCHICRTSHSESKGGGESSTAGKGKQLESPQSSQPSTPSSRQGSTVGTASKNAWNKPLQLQLQATSSREGSVRPPQYQQSHAAASSVVSRPSMSSSRQGSYLGSGRSPPPYQQYQTAPSSRQVPRPGAGGPPLQQSHAMARPGSRPPAPTQQESSSPEFEWQTAKRKGKGKTYD